MSFNRLESWYANYKNETPESKDVMARTKDTYKGDAYLPWANMLGVLYRLDPDAVVEKVQNADGGYVFTDKNALDVQVRVLKTDKDSTTEDNKSNYQVFMGHMVKVRVTYFGKVYEEVYPIQDNKYEAVVKFDSNMVNKALQRCMARTISLATGIGWSLYEQGEAGQFEPDGLMTIPTPEKSSPVTVEKIGKSDDTVAEGQAFSDIELIAHLIDKNRDSKPLSSLIDNYNVVFNTKYAMTIDLADDSVDILKEKFSAVDNPAKVLKGISKVVS